MTLDDVSPGDSCRIQDLDLPDEDLQKLMDMGFVQGEAVKMIRNAPLLDPIHVALKGYQVAVRRSEAKGISVELL